MQLTTLVAARTSAVASSTTGSHRSLGLDIALSSARVGLVDSLDRDDGLLLAIAVVAWIGAARSARVIGRWALGSVGTSRPSDVGI